MRLDGPTLQRRAATRRGAAPSALERDLRAAVRGEVSFDAGHRAAYSHDASMHRQAPLGVVVPLDTDDVVAAVAVAREHGAPVLPRGGGTGLAGATVNAAVVIDASKHLTRVLDVDPERRLARVQPGVVRDELARAAAAHGLTFGPDTSTHAVATLGGMLGHNSCGVHSLTAGRTSDNTNELDVLLYDGTRVTVGAGRAPEPVRTRLLELRDRHADAIRAGFPDLPRRVSGYNLDELLPERGFHVARALVGSEGTLVTILEATVQLVEQPPHRALAVLGFASIPEAADAVLPVLELSPTGLEGMDATLLGDLQRLARGDGWLLAEFAAQDPAEAAATARRAAAAVGRQALETVVLTDEADIRRVFRTRE